MIKDNIFRIQGQIASVCGKIGRDPNNITLVGITKYADVKQIKEALEGGLTHIGENKVQQALKKFSVLDSLEVKSQRHMVGHLQTNKVKQALEIFDLIESVDSLKCAKEIEKQAKVLNRIVEILIQVNTSVESQKYGVDKNSAISFIEEVSELENIRIMGLMTIAPMTEDKEVIREAFKSLRQILNTAKEQFANKKLVNMHILSMGMTDDFEIALEEGSNMIRIGRAIFHSE